eukprot:scaffold222526_cov28-Tisochrysis_lutea.AAC.2
MLIAVAATSASLGALTLDSSNKVTSTLGDSKLMDDTPTALGSSDTPATSAIDGSLGVLDSSIAPLVRTMGDTPTPLGSSDTCSAFVMCDSPTALGSSENPARSAAARSTAGGAVPANRSLAVSASSSARPPSSALASRQTPPVSGRLEIASTGTASHIAVVHCAASIPITLCALPWFPEPVVGGTSARCLASVSTCVFAVDDSISEPWMLGACGTISDPGRDVDVACCTP